MVPMTKYERDLRFKRISAKQRLIGLDMQTLQLQNEEKQQRQEEERLDEKDWHDHTTAVVEQLGVIENEQERVRRELETHAREFSLQHLAKDQRREFALSDPAALKNEPLTRLGDHDARLGVSSVQIMTGEDLLMRDRQKQQHQQQRSWIEQQIYDKQWQQQLEQEEEKIYSENVDHVVKLREVIEHEEGRVRHEISRNIATYNKSIAFDEDGTRANAKRQEQDRDAQELEFWKQDSFLNELPNKGRWCKGANREELVENVQCQLQQAADSSQQRHLDAVEAEETARESEEARLMLVAMEQARNEQVRAMRHNVMQENLRLAEEQRARRVAEENDRRNGMVMPLF